MSDYENGQFHELDWEDEIENEGSPFQPVPAGDYKFTVRSFERGRYNGGSKIPPCNMATLTLDVTSPRESGSFQQSLFLYSKMEWKLCQFFTSIGHRQPGQALKMNWSAVPGASGRCKVGIRKWTGKDGVERDGNEVLDFYEPVKGTAPVAAPVPNPPAGSGPSAGYTPGRF